MLLPIFPPSLRLRLGLCAALFALGACNGVDLDPIEVGAAPHDAGLDLSIPAPGADAGSIGPEDGERPGQPADAGPDATLAVCADDLDCPTLSHCGREGLCVADLQQPALVLPSDGVTRAGAARFDLGPASLEGWLDRAGPDCPDNRPGYFDGDLSTGLAEIEAAQAGEPGDPGEDCADLFYDLDGSGTFDAVWLAGAGPDRPAMGLDEANPPQGRVLVLARDDQLLVLLTLDVHAMDAARTAQLQRSLRARLGLSAGQIAVHTTGSRMGPDALGLDGPSLAISGETSRSFLRRLAERAGLLAELPLRSGVDEAWFSLLVERAALAMERALYRAEPVRQRSVVVPLPVEGAAAQIQDATARSWQVPDANEDGRANDAQDLAAFAQRLPPLAFDSQLPPQPDPWLRVLLLESTAAGSAVALVGAWGAAPGLDAQPILSAGYPGVFRSAVEAELGGVGLWLTAAGADTVSAGPEAFIPEVDAEGYPINAAGARVEAITEAQPAERGPEALGLYLARQALDGLKQTTAQPSPLTLSTRVVWLPFNNPRLALASDLGLLPHMSAWVSERALSRSWASSTAAPACGGIGCVRYQLHRIDLGEVSLLLGPGALPGGLVRGQPALHIDFADERGLRDLNMDGEPDGAAPIEWTVAQADRDVSVRLLASVNPQRFSAVGGLETDARWLIGRVGGGLGTYGLAASTPPVFEGQLEDLHSFVRESARNAESDLCAVGYRCGPRARLGEVILQQFERLPHSLVDLLGGHEVRLVEGGLEGETGPYRYEVLDRADEARLRGDALFLGPGSRAFAPRDDLRAAGVERGDRLQVSDDEAKGSYTIAEILPLILRAHPNAGGAWQADSVGTAELLYNALCELSSLAGCASPLPLALEDPNLTLPRQP